MKSGKQRREEIKAKRLARLRDARASIALLTKGAIPLGAVAADLAQLVHNRSYSMPPAYYLDRPFVCKDCGAHQVWTAKQQKWWYEIAKGPIDSGAVRCRPCRLLERARVDEARRVSEAGMAKKQLEKQKNEKV